MKKQSSSYRRIKLRGMPNDGQLDAITDILYDDAYSAKRFVNATIYPSLGGGGSKAQ